MTDSVPGSAACDPTTEAGRRELDRVAGLPQNTSDRAEAWLSRGHEWVEVSAFAGRFCARCGVDEDDQDDVRWNICCPEAAHVD